MMTCVPSGAGPTIGGFVAVDQAPCDFCSLQHDGGAVRIMEINGSPLRMCEVCVDKLKTAFVADRQAIIDAETMLRDAVAEAERGETVSLGSFAQYLDE